MILVTGGAGFIGSHVVRALAARGEECVLVQRSPQGPPTPIAGIDVHVVQADIGDRDALLAVGDRFPITGIVHLAGSMPWPPSPDDPVGAARHGLDGLFNVVGAAQLWNVHRVVMASTIGVYGGVAEAGPLSEDRLLSMKHLHVIPTFKKIGELLAGHLATVTDVDVVQARISGVWGPGGHLPSRFFPAPAFVYAAARGLHPDLSGMLAPPRAADGLDLCYVEDIGRAITMLQLADRLNHDTYNVGSGHATTNAEVVAAIRAIVPGFDIDLPDGSTGPLQWLDITRLHDDTGYRPEYDLAAAVSDYLRWLRDGHDR